MDDMTSRRRRRPILACEPCRRKKIKCDHNIPCGPCTRSRTSYCSYLNGSDDLLSKKQRVVEGQSEAAANTTIEDQPLSVPSSAASWFGNNYGLPLSISRPATSIIVPDKRNSHCIERQESSVARGTFLRGRFYGPSHWISFYQHLPNAGLDHALYQDYESLVSSSGRRRSSSGTVPRKLAESIPPREVSNQLVLAYFRTFESVLRVLHVPSFIRECQQYWEAPQDARSEFLLQLGLVMAIGASFSPQPTAGDRSTVIWVEAAQDWLGEMLTETDMSHSDATSNGGMEMVQIFCLLLEARQAYSTDKRQAWIFSPDSLVRAAEHVGLHIDPKKLPGLSFYQQEMRRRLWTTVQELALQAAVDDGRPPLLLRTDDNGPAPWNLEDEQFDTETTTAPLTDDNFTHTSIQITLHKSFPIRLAIADAINDVSNDMCSYSHALEISSQILAESRAIFARIQNRASSFAARLCELLLHRFLLTLHAPFALHARTDPTRYYSRKVATEVAMSMLRRCSHVDTDDYARLLRQGSGLFAHVPVLAASILCYDLADGEPFSSTLAQAAFPVTRTSLQDLVDAYLHVLSLRIEAGSDEIRPYVLLSAQLDRIHAARAGQAIDNRLVITRVMQLCQQMRQGRAGASHLHADGQQSEAAYSSNDENVGSAESYTLVRQSMSTEPGFDISAASLDGDVPNPLSEDSPWMIGFL
ncbi:hypothetical protein F4775DRAFT_559479 [Biscogniauxia sp. FL1348]|nr:hypothetical protein F4775DRAFT_559479 [Biscogniauxia sp. FL1348]